MKTNTQMTLLSFLAYADFFQSDIDELEKKVRETLLSAKTAAGITDVVWGPAASKKGLERQTSCLAYAVRHESDGGSPQYTLAIRGTNPISIASWIFQDLDVAVLLPWKDVSKHTRAPTDARISKATADSLDRHRELASGGKTFLEWLMAVLDEVGAGTIRLNVTGHSLGGLMSSTFALWLRDELVAAGMEGRVELRVYAYAGPTAGNEAFARYLDAELADRCTCFVNDLDIATHVWVESDMRDVLPNLYGPRIKPNESETSILTGFTKNIEGKGYAAPKRLTKVKAKLARSPLLRDYLVQAAYQHVVPYLLDALFAAPAALGKTASSLLTAPPQHQAAPPTHLQAAAPAAGEEAAALRLEAPQREALDEYMSGRLRAGSLNDRIRSWSFSRPKDQG